MGFTNAYAESISVSASQILSRDNKLVFATGGTDGIVITLYPAQNGDTLAVTVVKVDSGAGAVQVIGQNISVNLTAQFQSTSAQFTGAGWQEFANTGAGGGGGGTPGTPALSFQGASADDTAFVGIAGTSFDPTDNGGIVFDTTALGTGGGRFQVLSGGEVALVALGEDGAVLSSRGTGPAVLDATPGTGYAAIQGSNGVYIISNGTSEGIELDATGVDIGGGGTGPITITSAGGVSITDNSAAGINFQELGVGGFHFSGPNSSFELDDVVDDGVGVFFATSGPFSASALKVDLIGAVSVLDIDDTVSGVATLSTIFNAVGGYQANGVAGISGSGTSMTGVTVTNGLITAATFA